MYLVLYVSRKKVLFNTGVKVEPDLWDQKAKQIRKEHPNASDFNLIIKNAESLAGYRRNINLFLRIFILLGF